MAFAFAGRHPRIAFALTGAVLIGLEPAVRGPDPALTALRGEQICRKISDADYAVTIYPWVVQTAFRPFTRTDDAVWMVRLGWLFLEATAMVVVAGLLTRAGGPPSDLPLYA